MQIVLQLWQRCVHLRIVDPRMSVSVCAYLPLRMIVDWDALVPTSESRLLISLQVLLAFVCLQLTLTCICEASVCALWFGDGSPAVYF